MKSANEYISELNYYYNIKQHGNKITFINNSENHIVNINYKAYILNDYHNIVSNYNDLISHVIIINGDVIISNNLKSGLTSYYTTLNRSNDKSLIIVINQRTLNFTDDYMETPGYYTKLHVNNKIYTTNESSGDINNTWHYYKRLFEVDISSLSEI
jgi:hypothetical protein